MPYRRALFFSLLRSSLCCQCRGASPACFIATTDIHRQTVAQIEQQDSTPVARGNVGAYNSLLSSYYSILMLGSGNPLPCVNLQGSGFLSDNILRDSYNPSNDTVEPQFKIFTIPTHPIVDNSTVMPPLRFLFSRRPSVSHMPPGVPEGRIFSSHALVFCFSWIFCKHTGEEPDISSLTQHGTHSGLLKVFKPKIYRRPSPSLNHLHEGRRGLEVGKGSQPLAANLVPSVPGYGMRINTGENTNLLF